jgi:hypothetical protein
MGLAWHRISGLPCPVRFGLFSTYPCPLQTYIRMYWSFTPGEVEHAPVSGPGIRTSAASYTHCARFERLRLPGEPRTSRESPSRQPRGLLCGARTTTLLCVHGTWTESYARPATRRSRTGSSPSCTRTPRNRIRSFASEYVCAPPAASLLWASPKESLPEGRFEPRRRGIVQAVSATA